MSSKGSFGTVPGSATKRSNFSITPDQVTRGSIRVGQNLPDLSGMEPPRPHDTAWSTGPSVAGMGAKTRQGSGPLAEMDPTNFLGGTVSLSEMYIYWALEKLYGREGMMEKGVLWLYQKSEMGGRHILGGAVVDFVVYLGDIKLGLRIQTYQFHHKVGSEQQSHDLDQLIALSSYDLVIVDIQEQDFIQDETGQAAIAVVLDAVNRKWRPDPLSTGNVIGGTG